MENEMIDVWYIDCSTGCSCCSDENFKRGFYKVEDEAKETIAKFLRGEGNPLASQYARYGRYYLSKSKAEILPDGRMIVENRVYPANYFGDDVRC